MEAENTRPLKKDEFKLEQGSSMRFGSRLKAIRKLLFRQEPYIMIPVKPQGMLRPRPNTHQIAPVTELLEARLEEFGALIENCSQHFEDAEATMKTIGTNGYFYGADATLTFALMRVFQPRQIMEVGSGNSSYVLRAALGDDLRLTCIDPAPRRDITEVANTVIQKPVTEVRPEDFSALGNGDVLFIDGSHYSFNGTDVTYLFLEVMPILPVGVIVHIHDIFLPYEYSQTFTERHYNEQYLLAALLLGGKNWQPILPLHFCFRKGLTGDGNSFWIRRSA